MIKDHEIHFQGLHSSEIRVKGERDIITAM